MGSFRRLLGILGLSFFIPPAGWALLFRAPWRWWTKAGLLIIVFGLGVGHLMAFWGLRWQLMGDGNPRLYFPPKASHYDTIEKKASQDRAQLAPPAAPDPEPAVAAIPVAQKEPLRAAPVKEPPAQEAAAAKETTIAGYWPAFFGANRDAQYRETPILTAWPAKGLPELWRRPVGGGYASVVVADGRVFTIEQRREQEAAVAYDFEKGRELWAVEWKAHFQESMGGNGPRATPTYDRGKLYVLGAEGEFRCLNAVDGRTLWRKNILTDNNASNIMWGMSSAPLVVDDKVIVLPGGSSGNSVVAYNKSTGARAWSALSDKQAYTAPMLVTLTGRRQVLTVSASRAVGLAPEDGKILWEFPWVTEYDVNSSLPVIVDGNRFVLTAGYGHGSALVEISAKGASFSAREVWKSQSLKNRFNASALYNGIIYGLDEGIMVAIDAATGQRKWKGGRYGYGQFLMAGGYLVILTETGELVLVKANPEKLEEVARFQAIEGKTWNPPAIAGGRLLVRNTTEMACYKIAP